MKQPILSTTKVRLIISLLTGMILVGTITFYILEPFTWIQAFYFAVSTMSTVGYGDLVPSSDLTRLVVALYIMVSVSMYVSFITYLGVHILDVREKQLQKFLQDNE